MHFTKLKQDIGWISFPNNIVVEWYKQKVLPPNIRAELNSSGFKICKRQVSDHYLKTSLKRASVILVFRDPEIKGFVFLNSPSPKKSYIDLICSNQKGVGSNLLLAAEELSRIVKKETLFLSAIGPAEGFYRYKGYIESDKPCLINSKKEKKGDTVNGFRYTKCLGKMKKTLKRKKKK